jgi:hypothetical protein
VVKNVKEIGRDFNLIALVERSCLTKASVQVPESQAAERVTGAVASVGSDIDRPEIGGSSVGIVNARDISPNAEITLEL